MSAAVLSDLLVGLGVEWFSATPLGFLSVARHHLLQLHTCISRSSFSFVSMSLGMSACFGGVSLLFVDSEYCPVNCLGHFLPLNGFCEVTARSVAVCRVASSSPDLPFLSVS